MGEGGISLSAIEPKKLSNITPIYDTKAAQPKDTQGASSMNWPKGETMDAWFSATEDFMNARD